MEKKLDFMDQSKDRGLFSTKRSLFKIVYAFLLSRRQTLVNWHVN